MPMMASLAYRTSKGYSIVQPDSQLGYIENLLRMLFKNPMSEWKCDPRIIKIVEKLFIVHADHGQCESTTTLRIAVSSQANPYACIAAAMASLWGHAHGGADEEVIKMFEKIGSVENIPAFLEGVKQKKYLLMGFGHRIYKTYDPRGVIVKQLLREVEFVLGDKFDRKLMDIALELERRALEDDYFISRKLFPNVDYYTGIIYRSLGLPENMYTVMFSLARSIGWMAQYLEQTKDRIKINRPRQIYIGETNRKFVKIGDRPDVKRCIKIPKENELFNLPEL